MKKSIITADETRCFVCGSSYRLERHHCIHGTSGRKLADKYGLTVPLCFECHRGTEGVHGRDGAELDLELKQIAQRKWEGKHGGREAWLRVFGKSYL